MDIMIENDTRDSHWQLSLKDSNALLEFLFLDDVLFLKEKGQLAQNSGHYSMDQILKFCISEGLCQPLEKTKRQHWHTAPHLEPDASMKCESPLAIFFNQVLECAKKACSVVEYRWVVFYLSPD